MARNYPRLLIAPHIKFVVTEELSVGRYRANFMALRIMLRLARLSSVRLILRRRPTRQLSSSCPKEITATHSRALRLPNPGVKQDKFINCSSHNIKQKRATHDPFVTTQPRCVFRISDTLTERSNSKVDQET